jgi:hypothetical protein
MGTGSFPGVESRRGVTLTPLAPRSKKQSRAIPLLSLRVFVACKKGETYQPTWISGTVSPPVYITYPPTANKKATHNFGSEYLRNRVFGRKRWGTIVHNPISQSNISIKVKITGSNLAGHTARILEIRNAWEILNQKPERKTTLRRHRLENYINAFQSNFSATRILPSSYLFWAGKRLVGYL